MTLIYVDVIYVLKGMKHDNDHDQKDEWRRGDVSLMKADTLSNLMYWAEVKFFKLAVYILPV